MKHLVKSFAVGIMNGLDSSMGKLDNLVAELGDITIHSLTDTYYSYNQEHCPDNGPSIVRVVVYSKA